MGQLIDRIWEMDFEFSNYNDSDTKELMTLFDNARKQLEAQLDPNQQALFEEYREYLSEYYARIEKKAFTNGFSLGTRMSAEAFADSEKLIGEDLS